MKRLAALFAVISLAVVAALGFGFRDEVRSWIYTGVPLMWIQAPGRLEEVRVGSVELLISFAAGERVAQETFLCQVNGKDVTGELTVGRNGVAGNLVGLREGENRIRVRVFGRSFWGSSYVEEERSFVVRVQPFPRLDLA
jgi:hypothetical protein